MLTKFLTTLGIVATVSFIASPVSAQSSRNTDGKGYTLSGDSLTGINERTANEDFSIFFTNQPNSATPVNSNQEPIPNMGNRRTDEQLKIGDTPVFIEPAQETVNGSDGVQVQFDLTNIDRRQD